MLLHTSVWGGTIEDPIVCLQPLSRVTGGQLSQKRCPDFPGLCHLLQLILQDSKALPRQPRDILLPACPESSLGPPPGGIWPRQSAIGNTFPSYISWLFSVRRSSSSTPGSFWVTELLILSLTVSPATQRRKLISAAYIHNLVLSVVTQSSQP